MAATKDIICPHCKKPLPLESFEHDEDLNFICNHCRKVVFGVTDQAEAELKKIVGVNPHQVGMGFSATGVRKEPLPIRDATVVVAESSVSESSPCSGEEEASQYQCFI